jgi:hypothetical protein
MSDELQSKQLIEHLEEACRQRDEYRQIARETLDLIRLGQIWNQSVFRKLQKEFDQLEKSTLNSSEKKE